MNTYKAKVQVTLKDGVLDPQGKAVNQGIASLGFKGVQDVRIGKFIELTLTASSKNEAQMQIQSMSEKLLANPVIEKFDFTLSRLNGEESI